ncbi:HlyD family secretion protein [Methylomicrobium lacus]|uniref:HlyD family secretion protein n=1 Tax=Methylomicrobium lacus TaxID=136992 RepID=UPI0035A99129
MPSPFSSTTRALTSDTALPSGLCWLVSGLLAAAWLAWFFFARITVYETSAKARLEVMHAANPVAARTSGSIASVHFALGQTVKAGDVLIQLDDRVERLRLAEEDARKQALPKQIQALERQIEAQRAVLMQSGRTLTSGVAAALADWHKMQNSAEIAKQHAQRSGILHDKGMISEYEWLKIHGEEQQAQLAAESQAAEIRRLEADTLGRANQAHADLEEMQKDLADLQGQLHHSEAAALRLAAEIEKHRIIAPTGGRIGEIVPEAQSGAFLAEGQAVAKIVPLDGLKVVAQFLPKDALGRLRPGQHGRLRLDAFPWAQYGSVEVAVARTGDEIHQDYQQVELTIPASSPLPLQHGLTGTVEVAVETASPAYLVLRAAGQLLTRPALAAARAEELARR